MQFWLALLLAFCPLILLSPNALAGCPGFLTGRHVIGGVRPSLIPKRSDLRLFVSTQNGKALELPLQIDPIDKNGKIKFYTSNLWRQQPLNRRDRIALPVEKFSSSGKPKVSGCEIFLAKLVSNKGKSAYLFSCKKRPQVVWPPVITHNEDRGAVIAPFYRYQYAAYNHLLFTQLNVAYDRTFYYPYIAASKSDQLIIADIPYFFKMQFGARDFDARIINKRAGAIALVGQLSFILKILLFEIDLELSPEVSFFKESVYIPMIMHLPVNARKYLNSGSGLYYSWLTGGDLNWNIGLSKMPLRKSGAAEAYCHSNACHFNLIGELGLKLLILDFIIPRKLVVKGFYPQWVPSLAAEEEQIKSSLSGEEPHKRRVAVYFETSGLDKGSHGWDFWLRVGQSLEDIKQFCGADNVRLMSAEDL